MQLDVNTFFVFFIFCRGSKRQNTYFYKCRENILPKTRLCYICSFFFRFPLLNMRIFIRKSTTLAFVLCDEVTVGECGTDGSVSLLLCRHLCLTLSSCGCDGLLATLAQIIDDVGGRSGLFLDAVRLL